MAHPSGRPGSRDASPRLAVRSLAAGLLLPAAVGSTALVVGLLTYMAGGLLSGWAGRLVLGASVGGVAGAAVSWLQGGLASGDPDVSPLRWSAAGAAGLAAAAGVAAAVAPLLGHTAADGYAMVPVSGWGGMVTAVAGGLAMGIAQVATLPRRNGRLRWWPGASGAGGLVAFLAGSVLAGGVPAESAMAGSAIGLAGAGVVFLASTGRALLWLRGDGSRASPAGSWTGATGGPSPD